MRFFARPYNADIRLLQAAFRRGTRLSGIVVDAHMWRMVRKALEDLRADIPHDGEVFLDPVTHKIDRPFFRKKPTSYRRLSYFLGAQIGTRAPTLSELDQHSSEIALSVFKIQHEFGVTSFLTPTLYVTPEAFTSRQSLTAFSVCQRWAADFLNAAAGRSVTLSMCIDVECLRTAGALGKIESFIRTNRADAVYLTLGDFDLGQNRVVDRAVFAFLQMLRENGVQRILYSRAPPWMSFLAPHGVTDMISGVNFQSIFKLADIEREEDIDGIAHNYYLPYRFCRMTSQQASEALGKGLIEGCSCPVCRGRIPAAWNDIREHYVHARRQECAQLQAATDRVELLHRWLDEAERFVGRVKDHGLRVLGNPTPTLWRSALTS